MTLRKFMSIWLRWFKAWWKDYRTECIEISMFNPMLDWEERTIVIMEDER